VTDFPDPLVSPPQTEQNTAATEPEPARLEDVPGPPPEEKEPVQQEPKEAEKNSSKNSPTQTKGKESLTSSFKRHFSRWRKPKRTPETDASGGQTSSGKPDGKPVEKPVEKPSPETPEEAKVAPGGDPNSDEAARARTISVQNAKNLTEQALLYASIHSENAGPDVQSFLKSGANPNVQDKVC